jgi:hypothetical protein
LSIHPERIEASTSEKPQFCSEKARAEGTITKLYQERKGETAEKAGKMGFFLGHVQNEQGLCGLAKPREPEKMWDWACAMLFHSQLDDKECL